MAGGAVQLLRRRYPVHLAGVLRSLPFGNPSVYPALVHASSFPYVHDGFALTRLIKHAQDDDAALEREPYRQGKKLMTSEEAKFRHLDFFIAHQFARSQELRRVCLREEFPTSRSTST